VAIVERPTKKGIVFWVVTKGHSERVGFDRREAERLNARRKKEAKAGTFRPAVTGAITVRSYLGQWLDARSNRSIAVERMMIRVHVLEGCAWLADMKMEDVRPLDAKRFVLELKAKRSAKTGEPLKPKYIANVNGVMKAAFNAAVLDEVITRDVWRLPPGLISKKSAPKVPYSRDDARALLASAEYGRLVWLALAFYTGMRCGEVCGRRWRDWDETATPLGCLTIGTQYNDQPLKTDNPRKAPVHPELARILTEWRSTGFDVVYRRKPRADDFIVPSFGNVLKPLTRSAAYKAIAKDCARAEVVCRGQHATRHTFISAANRDGADQKTVETITHNAAGAMIDQYTHREWDELCAAVSCLRPYGQKLVALLDWDFPEAENKGEEGSDSRTRTKGNRAERAESVETLGADAPEGGPNRRGKRAPGAKLAASKDPEEADFEVALVEQGARARAAELLARPLTKAKGAPYVARKRGAR
jgi:integrase